MICLTGDVHHMTMRTSDQTRLAGTEASAALDYAEIAAAKGIKVTLFATGRSVVEETPVFREIGRVPGVELGGHGHRGRRPRWLYELGFRRALGQANGPPSFEAREIGRTVRAFREGLGRDIRSWRDHAYRRGPRTYRLLAAAGVVAVSDEPADGSAAPRRVDGLVSLPINVWPDHDCLAHGRYAGALPRRVREAAPWLPERYLAAGEWLAAVLGQVDRIERRGGLATLLVHPACMGVLDGFATFRRLCAALGGAVSVTAAEAAASPGPERRPA